MIQKTLRGTIQLLGGFGAGLAIVVVLLAWRLASGPISLGFLSPYIEQALKSETAGYAVRFDDTILTWAGWRRTLDVRIVNVRAMTSDGNVLATVPELSVSLSVAAMVRGLVAPRSVELYRPTLHLTRHADGSFDLAAGSGGDEAGALVATLVSRLSVAPDPGTALGYLSRVSIHQAAALINDLQAGVVWHAPTVEAEFQRDAKGIAADVTADVRLDENLVRIAAVGSFEPNGRRFDFGIEFANLVPAQLAKVSPRFATLGTFDLPVHGVLVTSVTGEGGIESLDFDLAAGPGTVVLPDPMPQHLTVASAAARGRFDGAARTWDVDEISVTLPDGGTLQLPYAKGYAVPLRSVSAAGRFDGTDGTAEITRLDLDLAGPKLSARATVQGLRDAPSAGVSALLTGMPIDSVKRYWPENWATDAREWIVGNMSAGSVPETHLSATVRTNAKGEQELVDLSGTMKIDDATVDYFAPLPKATHAYGTGTFSDEEFKITVLRGEAAGLQVKGGTLHFKDFQKYDQTLDIDLLIHGPFRNALTLLDHEPLGFARDLGIEPSTASGNSATNLHLDFPLIAALTNDGINVSAAARLTEVKLPDIVLGRDVTNGDLELRVDKKAMEVTGTVDVGKVASTLSWNESFDSKSPDRSTFRLSGTVGETQWISEFGLDFPPFSAEYLRGSVPSEILWRVRRNGEGVLDATLDLKDAELTLPVLNWSKPVGTPGTARATLKLKDEKVVEIPAFEVASADLKVAGSVAFSGADTLGRIDLRQFDVGRTSVRGTMVPGSDGGWTVALHGDALDGSDLFKKLFGGDTGTAPPSAANAPSLSLSVDIGRVLIGKDRALGRVKGSFAREGSKWRSVRLDAEVNDGKPLYVVLDPGADGNRMLSIVSDDAGATLRAFDYYSRIIGGKLELTGRFDDSLPDPQLSGRLSVSDFRVVGAPPLARLLSLLALTGIVESLQGDGIKFGILDVPFVSQGDTIEIKDARASGSSIGLTASGRVHPKGERIDLEGTIVPAYALNAVFGKIPVLGNLLTGGESGSGVFAATFSITGDVDKTTVHVNPLSALAPGFLRKLFGIFDAPEQADNGDTKQSSPPPR